jgi:ketosteroid isomerase-like protein
MAGAGREVAGDARASSVAVLTAFYEAFNRGNMDAAVEFLHPRFEWRPAFGRALMGHNVYRGRDGFKAYYRDIQDAFAEYRTDVEDLEAIDDELLLVHVRSSGVGRMSGATIARQFVIRYELGDGLIVRGQTFDDREQALADAG